MQPGVGPKIEVVDIVQGNTTTFAKFDFPTKVISVHKPLVNGLDAVNGEVRYNSLVMLMTITTLHEFVHYGRDVNKLSALIDGYEAGYTFEMNIQPPGIDGSGINRNTAIEWIKYYEYKIPR